MTKKNIQTPKYVDKIKVKRSKLLEKKKKNIYSIPFEEITTIFIVDVEGRGDINNGKNTFGYERGEVIYDPQKKEILYAHSNIDLDLYNNAVLMDDAFFGNKRSIYDKILNPHTKEDDLLPKYYEYRHHFSANRKNETLESFNETLTLYKPSFMFAYNCRYDFNTIFNDFAISETSNRRFTKLDFVCIADNFLLMLKRIPQERDKYIQFAKENDFTTPSGRASYKAEYVIRYIRHCLSYREEHMGLFDALDELEILLWINETYKKYGMCFMVEVNNLTYVGINQLELLAIR